MSKENGASQSGGRGPNRIVEKPKNFKKAMGSLLGYCKPHTLGIVIALIMAVGSTVLTIIGPNKIKEMTNIITDGMMTGIDIAAVVNIAWILVAFYSSSVILGYLQGYIMATITQKLTKRMRQEISVKINKLPLKYLDSHSYGDVLSRVTNDADTIGQPLNNSIVTFVSSVVLLFGSLIMMFITNWILALCSIGSALLGFTLIALIMSKSQKHFVAQQKYLGELNGQVEEVYSGHSVVKAYNAEEEEGREFKNINSKLYNSAWKAQFLSGLMMPIMNFIGNLGYVVVCVVGAALAVKGVISFGVIVAFMIYVRLFTQPLSQLAQVFNSLQSAGAASERVFEFLNEDEMEDEKSKNKKLGKVKGRVNFNNVRFGYDEDKTIIKNFSLDVLPGQKIAIVGPTGAGKTTLVNLLMRFYELKQPRLIINGTLTNYKIFDCGKSLSIKIDEDRTLIIGGEKTDLILNEDTAKNLPKNTFMKFDQNFNLNVNGVKVDYTVDIITGDKIDQKLCSNLGVAYYGDVLIDSVPTKELSRDTVHEAFSMVLQDTWIFEGSVKENIIYSKQGVTDEDVIRACEACGIDHFIKTLSHGYDTILDESTTISSGQRQLITIARAMVQDCPMLILDEATSSVDTRTEIVIQEAMDKLMKGRTTFVIAHRLSTIKNSDKILVMKEGNVIEIGKHDELMAADGFYAKLYNSQFTKKHSEVI